MSTGAVYLVVGFVALTAAVDAHIRVTGSQGALHRLLERPLGAGALIGIPVGLIADGGWQLVRAATDADRAGAGLRGWAERQGGVVSGLVHVGLAVAAIKLVIGIPQATSEAEARWVGDVDKWLDLRALSPAGRFLVLALGEIGLLARAVVYAVIAWFLLVSAVTANSVHARGLGGAFRAIRYERYGPPVLAAIALGFIANGVVEVLRARYRRIQVG